MNEMVVYKFGARRDRGVSAMEGIKFHYAHAVANDGKVLFTVKRFPDGVHRDMIDQILLTTKDGSYAVLADVDQLGRFDKLTPPDGYTIPSIWNDERDMVGWFALSNLREVTIEPGTYTTINGNDLLQSISGRGYLTYVPENEE